MTNRQLAVAVPMVFVMCAVNMGLFTYAFVLEWSHRQRLYELLCLALTILFFAVFLVFMEVGFISELLQRRRAKGKLMAERQRTRPS